MKVLRAMFFLLNPTSEHSPQGWRVCVAGLLEPVAGKCWACQVEPHRPPGDKSCCPVVTATICVLPEPDQLLLSLQPCRGTPSHSWGGGSHGWGFPVTGGGLAGQGMWSHGWAWYTSPVKGWPTIPSNCRLCGAAGSSVDGGAAVF